jgi:hypothetical protein
MAKKKSIDRDIVREYAILLAFYENIRLAEDPNLKKEDAPWWVKEIDFTKKKVLNVLRAYAQRYDELAAQHFLKCYKGIDKESRETEVILPLFAYIMLERYKMDYENKKIGKGVVPPESKLFDMYDELIEDIANYYKNNKATKESINITIDIAEKFFKKLKDTP